MLVRMQKYLSSYLPPATQLGQGYIFTGVCDFVRGGVCLSACWDTTPGTRQALLRTRQAPWDQAPPPRTRQAPPPRDQAGPPLRDQAGTAPSPPEMSILGDTVNERAVCILLECNLVDMSDDLAA